MDFVQEQRAVVRVFECAAMIAVGTRKGASYPPHELPELATFARRYYARWARHQRPRSLRRGVE